MSALATIVSSLGELSESELQQLYLMVGVRLGIPGGSSGSSNTAGAGARVKGPKPKSSGGKTSKTSTSSKGNPQRKSQWANHPLWKEYSRLKKVVEAQSREQKCSFNAVDTAESRAYKQAFNQWLEAKSSFRGHGESGQIRESPEERKGGRESDSEEEDEEEATETAPTSPPTQRREDAKHPLPETKGEHAKRASPPAGSAGKSSSPKGPKSRSK